MGNPAQGRRLAVKCPKCSTPNPSDSSFCGRCGTSLLPAAPPAGPTAAPSPGETLLMPVEALATGATFAGRYQVVEELGQGGMGRVYKVLDHEVGEPIALKLLRGEIATREDTIRRFREELRLARRISHKNVCRMFDLGSSEGTYFITMEYVDGEDLKKFIRRSGQLTVGKAVAIARQVGEGLAEAHRLGVVHRDLKPQNIMIDGEGNARIMDFGIARSIRAEGVTGTGVMIGTPEYMSPEQVDGRAADPRADIYALAVILYEMLAGRLPFEGDTPLSIAVKHKTEAPPDPRALNPAIPAGLAGAILKCLEKDREKRYGSIAGLLADLERIGDEVAGIAESPPPSLEKARPRKMREPPKPATPKAPAAARPSKGFGRRKAVVPIAIFAVLTLSFAAYLYLHRNAKVDWARGTALPEVMRLIGDGKLYEAFLLARKAEEAIPEDPRLAGLWPEMSREVSIETEPPGARISIKAYKDVEGEWHGLGTTPLSAVRVPQEFLRWKVEKADFKTVFRASFGSGGSLRLVLDRPENLPPRMVRVPGGRHAPRGPLLMSMEPLEMGDFLIDEFEVTNREFKEFVEKGGYADRRFWKNPFSRDGRNLAWEDAISLFTDRTGRPGPSTWELGGYPEGQDDHPVGGISWFEAAAFAEFSGKSLPTVYHWIISAGQGNSSATVPLSNFEGKGPAPGGRFGGLGPFGTYDMAGNVREWCWNAVGGMRYTMGGAWNDPIYKSYEPTAALPFDRSAVNGFRCVKYLSPESFPAVTALPLTMPFARNFDKETPAAAEVFAIYKRLYEYDKRELNAVMESVDDASPFWRKEKIAYDAAYGNERIIAYLYLPKKGAPPYQTVIFFPGDSAQSMRSSADLATGSFDFLVKSGRAVLYPVYKSTYERGDGFRFEAGQLTPNNWRDHAVMWYKDFARSIDYLESRPDVDEDRLAYLGYSWGGHQGVFLLGLETRIKAGMFLIGGFIPFEDLKKVPEADHINFAARITIPILMLNGRYDYIMPLEMSQKPMFRFLGTPEEHKRHILYDTDHNLPRNEMIKETLNWLDKYLGPVKN
jgi:dienelactone hydrolase/predicted Ser/Thr protein kinase